MPDWHVIFGSNCTQTDASYPWQGVFEFSSSFADAENKAKMDDHATFCAYLDEREDMNEEELDEEGYFINAVNQNP